MKTRHKVIAAGIAIAALSAWAWNSGQPKHIGPDVLYPDPALTSGLADTLDFNNLTASYDGQTYSQAHRNVSAGEKQEVCKEYPKNCTAPKEIDHFYPLCAGGSNDIKNLWAEPAVNPWNGKDFGFHTKDTLEAWVCTQIKAGKLDPKVAYQKMTTDWVKFYLEVNPDPQFGSIIDNSDTGE